MLRIFQIFLFLAALPIGLARAGGFDSTGAVPNDIKGVPVSRIEEVVAMLDDKPAGFGPTYHDRAAWDPLARNPQFAKVIPRAAEFLTQTFPFGMKPRSRITRAQADVR